MNVAFFRSTAGDKFSSSDVISIFKVIDFCFGKNVNLSSFIVDAINLGGPIAVREAKKLVRRVSELSIEAGFAETGPWSRRLFESEEGQEGITAFRGKRQPNWVK